VPGTARRFPSRSQPAAHCAPTEEGGPAFFPSGSDVNRDGARQRGLEGRRRLGRNAPLRGARRSHRRRWPGTFPPVGAMSIAMARVSAAWEPAQVGAQCAPSRHAPLPQKKVARNFFPGGSARPRPRHDVELLQVT
jgi:hypothetical protein